MLDCPLNGSYEALNGGFRILNTYEHTENITDLFLRDWSESVCVFLPDLTITYVNHRLIKIWGQPADKLIGQNLSGLLKPKSKTELLKLLRSISSDSPAIEQEYKIGNSPGNVRWQLWRLRGVFDGTQLMAVQAVLRDITREKQYGYIQQEHHHDLEQRLQTSTNELQEISSRLQQEILERLEVEKDYQELFDNASDTIYIRDLNGRFLSANQACLKFLGLQGDEIRNLKISDFLLPEYASIVEDKIADLINGLEVKPYEVEFYNLEGKVSPVEISPRLIYKNNQPFAVQVIVRNITERKAAERAIAESQQRMRDIIGFLPDPTFVINDRGTVIAWNLAMEELTGIKAENMLGKGNYAYAVPLYGHRRPMLIDQILASSLIESDYPILKENNGHLSADNFCPGIGKSGAHIYGTASALYDIQGEKVGAIESLRDVTAHKKMQMDLIQSEANFKHLADTAPAIIYILRGSNLLYINQALAYVTEYTKEDYLQMQAWDFIHPDDRDWVRDYALARQRGEEVPTSYQARLLKKDGSEMWAEFSTAIINFNDEPAVLGIAIDITARKEAEDKISYLSYHDRLTGLFNRAYAEEKSKELDHETNLPLSIIIGDVNGLKLVNDAFGHQDGDNLLKTAASILTSSCGNHDIVARWGGDEFVILLPKSDEERTLQICQTITQTCNELSDFPVQVSISLGMSTKSTPGKSMEQVSKEAEDSMYRNKLLESRSNRSSFIYSLEKTMWVRSHETQVHTDRLRQLVGIIAKALHLQREEVSSLALLASLHDIGKIAIPNSILDKPDRLSQEEWSIMQKHPEIGYRIALSCPELAPIAEAILAHHERWDGGGYPLGLKEREIPLVARILALADAYDVMLSGRSYQAALSEKEALAEISKCAGTQFDPDLAKLFICLVKGEELKPRMTDIF